MTTVTPLSKIYIWYYIKVLLDKAVFSRVWILMRDDREFEGTL